MFAEIVHYDVHVFVLLICHIIFKGDRVSRTASRCHAMPEHVPDRTETTGRREIRTRADTVHLITHNTEI